MTDNREVETIFGNAIEIASPREREVYLNDACRADADLRQEVNKLVLDYFRAGRFLERPLVEIAASTIEQAFAERPGSVVGPYKLLEQIGEGGFGVVYMAEQERPIRRKVALKVIKPGMDTRQVIARFEAERQALALMDHPNIARVFDGGETASGHPYFVMELVRGVPITEFCDQNHMSLRERLELFVSVCHAVQHAHLKGVIHRDLKPTNVLVTLYDNAPMAKVIDFGIAKATGQRLTERTLFTNFAQMMGTPLYMSPEQAQMSGLDVDTRTDIFSLGVLLYELLTGTTPFDKERVREASFDEIRRMIREEEPAKPSTRVNTLGQAAITVCAQRKSDVRRLSQLCRGDLDWIVMKAIERDRNRRYETASAFAADIERFLRDEAVEACPPSRWYRFRKFARRNKRTFVTGSAVAVALLLALATLTVSNVLIREEQSRTRDEKDRAEKAQRLAEDRAEENRQALERMREANSLQDRGDWYSAAFRWDDAHAAYTKAIELRPEDASAWAVRSNLYTRLGLGDLAAADYAQIQKLQEPNQAGRWFWHALLQLHVGDRDGYRQACQGMQERFGGTVVPDWTRDIVRTCVLSPDSHADWAWLVELAQGHADTNLDAWYSNYLLGIAHFRAGQPEQAARRLEESLRKETDLPFRSLSFPVLAMACHRLGDVPGSRQSLDAAAAAIDRWTQEMYQGDGKGRWVIDQGAVAHWPIAWWDWLECLHYYREAKLLIDGVPPPDDPRLHVLRARAFAGLRWHARADVEYIEALQLRPDDPQILHEAYRNRGHDYVNRRQWTKAAGEFQRARELQPDEATLWAYEAMTHLEAGEVDAYRQSCSAAVQRFEGSGDPGVACHVVYACVLRPDSLTNMERLLPLARVASPRFHFGGYVLGAALYRAGKYDDAAACFEKSAKVYRPRTWDWCFRAMIQQRLGYAEEARHCLAQAKHWAEKANRQKGDDPSGTKPAWSNWDEQIVAAILLREAEELLNSDVAPPQPSP